MAEYIEREATLKEAESRIMWGASAMAVYETIQEATAADVTPVRHGRWERIGIKGRKGLPIYPCCSACGTVSAAFRSEWEGLRGPWKYCPNCGARMDGDKA